MIPSASCATLGRALRCALEAISADSNTECLIRQSGTTFELFTATEPRALSLECNNPLPYTTNLLLIYQTACDRTPSLRVTNLQISISGIIENSALEALTSTLVNTP